MGLFILMMGVQGAGKGTQAQFLIEQYNIPQVSTGDLFRAMKTKDTPLAREVQALMKEGKLIPDDITNQMVAERLDEDDAQNGVILDGYPRNVDQAKALDEMLAQRGEKVTIVLVLELDRETAIKRAEGRRYSQDKQRVYNIYFNPPRQEGIDDVTGEPLIQREDDHRDAVEQRIDLYYEKTMPLVNFYRDRGLVVEVNADQSIEAVREDVIAAVESVRSGNRA